MLTATLDKLEQTSSHTCNYGDENFVYPDWVKSIADGITSEDFKIHFPDEHSKYLINRYPVTPNETFSFGGPYTLDAYFFSLGNFQMTPLQHGYLNEDLLLDFINDTKNKIGEGFLVSNYTIVSIPQGYRTALVCLADIILKDGAKKNADKTIATIKNTVESIRGL